MPFYCPITKKNEYLEKGFLLNLDHLSRVINNDDDSIAYVPKDKVFEYLDKGYFPEDLETLEKYCESKKKTRNKK